MSEHLQLFDTVVDNSDACATQVKVYNYHGWAEKDVERQNETEM